MKRTWKFRQLAGDAVATMASARSLAEAAAVLGLNKSTVFRLVKAGKLPAPGGRRRHVGIPPSSAGWGASIRAAYELSTSECELVKLAEAALLLAHNDTLRPSDRLAAMARFSQLVRQINLEAPGHGEIETPVRPFPRRVI